ncbi:MAG: FkbM family methyltransferase [Terriglobales bacterium]
MVVRAGDIVYDLGANVGFYSLLASFLVGSDGQVFSFEPVPRNLRFLRRHLDLNQIANCSALDVAVSSSNGVANFDLGPTPCQGHLTTESRAALTVRTVALDSLVASGKIPPPNVIKCDIEGGEYDALTGARDTLSRYRPGIFLATHGPEVHGRCRELLTSIGYNLTALDGLSLNESREILAVEPLWHSASPI